MIIMFRVRLSFILDRTSVRLDYSQIPPRCRRRRKEECLLLSCSRDMSVLRVLKMKIVGAVGIRIAMCATRRIRSLKMVSARSSSLGQKRAFSSYSSIAGRGKGKVSQSIHFQTPIM